MCKQQLWNLYLPALTKRLKDYPMICPVSNQSVFFVRKRWLGRLWEEDICQLDEFTNLLHLRVFFLNFIYFFLTVPMYWSA